MTEDNSYAETTVIGPGETIYDGDGQPLGRVVSMTDDGFEVETIDPDGSRGDDKEELPGQEFGEGYLMWRCRECGEMGDLEDGMPSTCPSCGAPEEALAEVVED